MLQELQHKCSKSWSKNAPRVAAQMLQELEQKCSKSWSTNAPRFGAQMLQEFVELLIKRLTFAGLPNGPTSLQYMNIRVIDVTFIWRCNVAKNFLTIILSLNINFNGILIWHFQRVINCKFSSTPFMRVFGCCKTAKFAVMSASPNLSSSVSKSRQIVRKFCCTFQDLFTKTFKTVIKSVS
jgi:hypothetical protein